MKFRNYRFIQYISIVLFFSLVSCEKDDVEPRKTRTLMVYLAGDNSLSSHMANNVNDMMSAWKESYNANIVVYFDSRGAAPELFTFDVKGKKAEKRVIKTYEDENSASAQNVGKVLGEMMGLYPSDSYGLIIGSHATGWIPPGLTGRSNRMQYKEPVLTRSFASDNSSEIDTRDLAKAIPSGLEFILFDACFMSSAEVLYDLKDKAKYVIASAAELPAPGFPYKEVMPFFWGTGEKLESDLVKVCENFRKYYHEYNSPDRFGTIALIKMDELDHLFVLTREVLKGKKEDAATMDRTAVYLYPKVEYGGQFIFFDLGDYIEYMTQDRPELREEYLDFLNNKVVRYKGATDPYYYQTIPADKFSGITTYIPLNFWPKQTAAYWGFDWSGVYD